MNKINKVSINPAGSSMQSPVRTSAKKSLSKRVKYVSSTEFVITDKNGT